MHYLSVTECRVPMGRMQQFTTLVQRWEQDVVGVPGGPELHAVYLGSDDPARVLVVTQFASKEDAEAFLATGRLQEFRDSILACTGEAPLIGEGWELFYAAGADGTRIVFGQDG